MKINFFGPLRRSAIFRYVSTRAEGGSAGGLGSPDPLPTHPVHALKKNRGISRGADSDGHDQSMNVVYLADKQKEEIFALHDEDPVRWSASVLSTRFRAPYENVQMLLRLRWERRQREKFVQGLSKDEKLRTDRMREQSVSAWKQLHENSSVHRQHSPSARGPSPGLRSKSRDRSGSSIDDMRAAVFESTHGKGGSAAENGTTESDLEVTEGDLDSKMKDNEEACLSEWAGELKEVCENAEQDAVRKWSFAFIEIGRKRDLKRGVWLREGQSGRLRIADEEERKLFLNQVNMRDSKAFSQHSPIPYVRHMGNGK